MSPRILISGGRVVDPASGGDSIQDLYIAGGRIVGLGAKPDGYAADLEIPAQGHIVSPGFIDLCARLREPGQEHKGTIASEGKAAFAGGITTLCCPPDTSPAIDSPAVVNLILEKTEAAGGPRILPIGALTPELNGRDLSEMGALKSAGCLAVGNAHAPMANTLVLRRAMEYAASHDLLVVVRPEDPYLADTGCVHEGPVSTRLGLRGIPYAAETVAVAQVLALLEPTGARVHFAQISCARAARAIARAQDKGEPVSADVAAHQLHLTEADIDGFDALCHVRPPLRGLGDRDALRLAVRDGTLAAICSDHQPHEPDAKLDAFPSTEPGISSLETLLPLTLALVEQGAMALHPALAALTSRPAALLGLDAGSLRVGAVADLCVFDPEAEWTVGEGSWLSRGRNTPFWGKSLKGRVAYTLAAGRVVFRR
ncbi:dihydroorotase [Methylomagnum ishizawai]|uniref:Dihydroorotase n=1 Tax=Methylomagnum ishizawai TaxID=1760988 RepID=A0A1Y6CT09_9GAMM|nr:dihydroorotase [Methylomagnum ishizawai]SMF93738.1 dihydroorotase [Methylomagnum ishizawai]